MLTMQKPQEQEQKQETKNNTPAILWIDNQQKIDQTNCHDQTNCYDQTNCHDEQKTSGRSKVWAQEWTQHDQETKTVDRDQRPQSRHGRRSEQKTIVQDVCEVVDFDESSGGDSVEEQASTLATEWQALQETKHERPKSRHGRTRRPTTSSSHGARRGGGGCSGQVVAVIDLSQSFDSLVLPKHTYSNKFRASKTHPVPEVGSFTDAWGFA